MSIDAMKAVWNHSRHSGTALNAMLALADAANADGYCWPSVATLANLCRCSGRQMQRIIGDLETSGELYAERGQGRTNTTRYLITLNTTVDEMSTRLVKYFGYKPTDAVAEAATHIKKGDIQREKVTPATPFTEPEKGDIQREKVTSEAEKVTSSAGKGDIAMSPDPLEPPIEPLENARRAGATPPQPKPATVVSCASPYLPKGSKLPGGYWPAGTGTNAVQIYYERFSFDDPTARLTMPKQNDLVRVCNDLNLLRRVVVAYSQTSYQAGNVRLILDWYLAGGPPARGQSASNANKFGRVVSVSSAEEKSDGNAANSNGADSDSLEAKAKLLGISVEQLRLVSEQRRAGFRQPAAAPTAAD